MSAVHFILQDSFGAPLRDCEVTFHAVQGASLAGPVTTLSIVCSLRTDSNGEATANLVAGDYVMRFPELQGVYDRLQIRVGNEPTYELKDVVLGGNWILPMRDFLQKADNLADLADPAAAFTAIKQAATLTESGVLQLATAAETAAGLETSKAVTPAALAPLMAGKSPIAHAAAHAAGAADAVSLDASQIVSGTLDVARIPVLPSQTVQISSGDLTALTAGQQSAIAKGTVVTTADGNRWVYAGSGNKTATASYIQLADITPDWSVIANKPALVLTGDLAAHTGRTDNPHAVTKDQVGLGSVQNVDSTNASTISRGVLSSFRGGAGTTAGLLKADGTGVVSAAVAGIDYRGPVIKVVKSANTTRSNTTTLSDDPDLVVTLPPGIWRVESLIAVFCASTTPGFFSQAPLKTGAMSFNLTLFEEAAGTQVNMGALLYPGSLGQVYGYFIAATNGNNSKHVQNTYRQTSVIQVTSTATAALQWAQFTASTDATTVLAGSHIIAEKIG